MGETSRIEWTDATWNPWHGCRPCSAGCDHCYAEAMWRRFGRDFSKVQRSTPATFNAPLRWQRKADGPRLVFGCSVSDFCIREADPWRAEAWDIMRQCQSLTFLLLTKRAGRLRRCLPVDWDEGWHHVWLGVTAENNDELRRRAGTLLGVPGWGRGVPHESAGQGHVRFLSIEPMLERIDARMLRDVLRRGIRWVIVGGESGARSQVRAFNEAHAQEIVDVCAEERVACFVKQRGTVTLPLAGGIEFVPRAQLTELPEPLQVRQWPFGFERSAAMAA